MQTGLDRLPSLPSVVQQLRSCKLGVLAHPASVDRSLRHISQVLASLNIKPKIFFGPEHGYGGEAQDMIGVADARDHLTNAPIVSLYGDKFEDLSPSQQHLEQIDTLLIDLADVGSRYYTFVWTALLAVRAAAKHNVRSIILDRPNPLGSNPAQCEGALQHPRFLSFVGLEPIPVRHQLTVGEIVMLFAARSSISLGDNGALSVVEVLDGPGHEGAWSWDRPFVQTSPNMPTLETALVYPGGCLLEGTNLSEGRGLTRPFEIVGAPFIDGKQLAERLTADGHAGMIARPVTFQPTFHKHAHKVCGGVQIHITDRNTFRPYETYVALVAHCHQMAPEEFRFRTERYEFVDDIPAFDLLTGSAEVREAILRNESPKDIAAKASRVDKEWFEQLD